MTRTSALIQAHALAQAVATAQQRANAEGRTFAVARGPRDGGPLVECLATLGIPGPLVVEFVDAGQVLLVSPQGSHRGLSAAEIVADSQ
jgi:hypothetical protein